MVAILSRGVCVDELTHDGYNGLVMCHKASQILVNIGWGNGLLLDGTKPLPHPILTYRK